MKKSSISEWHKRFKEWQENVLIGQDHACVFFRSQGGSSLWSHYAKDKRWINSVFLRCWQGYRTLFGGKGPNSGLVTGFSTMKIPLHIMRQEFASFWLINHYKTGSSTSFTWLSPCEFWLFPKLKNELKGQKFTDILDIQHNVTTILHGILGNNFQDSFWQCIASQEEFFKCDSSR
jgi:hypothetical protein